jgi:hypothetical protein
MHHRLQGHFAIVTTEPNELCAQLHNRMPNPSPSSAESRANRVDLARPGEPLIEDV